MIRSALTWKGFTSLLRSGKLNILASISLDLLEINDSMELLDENNFLFWAGVKTIKGALAMPLMIEGYKKDLIKFSIITCRKPEKVEVE